MNDDSTDKLFQEGAKRYEFEYNPEAWQQMEQLLDQDKAKHNRSWLAGFLFLLVSASFIWWYVGGQPTIAETQADNGKDAPVEQLTPKNQETITPLGAEDSNRFEAKTIEPANSTATPIEVMPSTTSPAQAAFSGSAGNSNLPQPTVEARIADNSTGGSDNATPRTTALEAQAAVSPQVSEQAVQPTAAPGLITNTITADNVVIEALPADDFELLVTTPTLPAPAANTAERFTPVQNSTNGLFLTAGAGRIYGGGGSMNFEQGENRIGLQLGYRFGKKFSLQAGAHYSNLSYCTEGQDYTANPGFWTDGIVATVVEAECQVLEIPLLLTYYPAGNANNGFYFTGGLNSYFLIREDFKFNYDIPRTDLISSWREDNTNRHIFGYGQFNIGYEKRLTKKTALQLESYVQLPLSGIGQGRVNLVNIGMSANFLFDFRK